MRGRTNISGGGGAEIIGTLKDYTVAPGNTIEQGSFVQFQREFSYDSTGSVSFFKRSVCVQDRVIAFLSADTYTVLDATTHQIMYTGDTNIPVSGYTFRHAVALTNGTICVASGYAFTNKYISLDLFTFSSVTNTLTLINSLVLSSTRYSSTIQLVECLGTNKILVTFGSSNTGGDLYYYLVQSDSNVLSMVKSETNMGVQPYPSPYSVICLENGVVVLIAQEGSQTSYKTASLYTFTIQEAGITIVTNRMNLTPSGYSSVSNSQWLIPLGENTCAYTWLKTSGSSYDSLMFFNVSSSGVTTLLLNDNSDLGLYYSPMDLFRIDSTRILVGASSSMTSLRVVEFNSESNSITLGPVFTSTNHENNTVRHLLTSGEVITFSMTATGTVVNYTISGLEITNDTVPTVKNYETMIHGVANQSGTAGQIIEVWVPN